VLPLRTIGQLPLQVGQLIVELDLHPHGSARLDEMRLIGQNKSESHFTGTFIVRSLLGQ